MNVIEVCGSRGGRGKAYQSFVPELCVQPVVGDPNDGRAFCLVEVQVQFGGGQTKANEWWDDGEGPDLGLLPPLLG